jgi:hypothetical protein
MTEQEKTLIRQSELLDWKKEHELSVRIVVRESGLLNPLSLSFKLAEEIRKLELKFIEDYKKILNDSKGATTI